MARLRGARRTHDVWTRWVSWFRVGGAADAVRTVVDAADRIHVDLVAGVHRGRFCQERRGESVTASYSPHELGPAVGEIVGCEHRGKHKAFVRDLCRRFTASFDDACGTEGIKVLALPGSPGLVVAAVGRRVTALVGLVDLA